MPTAPVPVNSGEVAASFATSITATSPFTGAAIGDVLIVGVSIDGLETIIGLTGDFLFVPIGSGTFGPGGDSNTVTASLWAATVTTPVSAFAFTAQASGEFDDAGLVWLQARAASGTIYADRGMAFPLLPPFLTVGSPPPPASLTTLDSDDLLLFFSFGHNGMWLEPPPSQVSPADWTWLTSVGNSGGFGFTASTIFYKNVTVPQSDAPANSASPITNASIFAVLALTADPPPPAGPTVSFQRGLAAFGFPWKRDPIAQGLH